MGMGKDGTFTQMIWVICCFSLLSIRGGGGGGAISRDLPQILPRSAGLLDGLLAGLRIMKS